MTFALLIGFGYFNVSLDDLAFTQPAPPYRYLTAESFDVPVPEQHQIIQFGPSGEPLSWVSYYTFTEQGEPPVEFPDFIQSANAETTHRRHIISADRIMNAGGAGGDFFAGKPCQDASGAFSGLGGYPANKRMIVQGQFTCQGYYHQNDIGQPMIPPELAKNIDAFGWQARFITGSGGAGCNTDSIIGIPTTAAGQGGTMTFEQAADNTTAKFSTSTAGCTLIPSVFPTAVGAGMSAAGVDFYRDLFETGIYPNGDLLLDTTTGEGRLGMLHSVPGLPWATRGVNSFIFMNQNWFFGDMSHIPTNATDGLWQIKEHSQYPTGIMDDCQFERLDDSFNIKTGTTDGEQGQCIILKTFNTGEQMFEDDFTTGFAHAAFDPNEWQTTLPSEFDINNATGKIEVFVSDTNDNAEGIRFNFPEIWEDDQVFITQVSWDNAVLTNGTGTHDLFYTVSKGAVTNRFSHLDAMSFSWQVAITGEKRFVTYFNDGDLSQDVDANGIFLNATDQGSAMDSGCMEMKREGRFFTWNFYTDTSCTILKDTLTRTVTTAGQISDFRYPSFHYSDQVFGAPLKTGSIALEVRDVKIWNGVSEVPTSIFKPDIKVEGFVNGTGSNEMRINVGVFDGKQDANFLYTLPQSDISFPSDFDFDENIRREDLGDGLQNFSNHRMGETEIDVSTPVPVPFSIEISPHYPSGSNQFSDFGGHFTVSIGLEDDSTDGILSANITKITVGEHEYDFAKPIVYYWEQTTPALANSGCGGCSKDDTQAIKPELDYGYVDTNYTTIAPFVTGLSLPNPTSFVTNVLAVPVSSINVTWTHDGANTTGYRIYRTSTEDTDEIKFFDTGILGTTNRIGIGSTGNDPAFHIERFLSGSSIVWTGEIISRVVGAFNTQVAGDTQNGELRASIKSGGFFPTATNTANIANSTTSYLNNTISTLALDPSFTTLPFNFIADDLKNITSAQNVDFGVGFTWGDDGVASRIGGMSINEGDALTGGSGDSRYVFLGTPTWSPSGGRDLRMEIYTINQTLLSSPAVPFINDTGTLDQFFLDSTTINGNTYFYQIFPINGNQEGPSIEIVNATQPGVPTQVTGLTLTHDNINSELDLTWNDVQFGDSYTVQRLSTERQIVESDSFGSESNFAISISGTNDIGGDDSGFDTFDIPTQVEVRTGRFSNFNPNNGQIVYGQWLNVISGGTNQVEPDLKSEVEQAGYMISSGTRLARDCNRVSSTVEQDGWTQRSSGLWFDGNCQVENRFLGTEIRNLTVAETANAEVSGAWRNMTSGGFSILRPFAGGGSGWVFQDTAPNKWFTGSGIEQKSHSMNQTWVNVTNVNTNSFSDNSTNNYNTYLYRVIAANQISQEGPPSSIVNGTLSLPPLRVPDLNGTDNGGSVDLVWEEAPIKFSRELSEDPVQGYIIQRATGENETTIYDGIGNAGEVFSADHDVEEYFLDHDGLTLITNPKDSSDRTHAGQQLNITSAINVTRIVAKVGCNGGCGNFNVEPDLTATIHFANGTFVTRSINPRLAMNADIGDAPSDKGFVNWVFSPPVQLEADEYIFGWQQRGVQSCNSNDCDTTVNRSFKVFFEFTGINNGSSGWGIGADNTGLFTDNPINGTRDTDMAMAIFAETTWETIGTTLGATNTTFTDNSPPVGSKSYRILAFNDAGVSHQPTLMHNPQNTTVIKMGNAFDFFPQDAQGRYTPGGPNGALNYGDMVTFAVPTGAVPNAPTGLSATADGVNINLDWNNQGDADSFNVVRNGTTIATNVLLSEFIDLMVAIGEFFSYTVVANNVNGSSASSVASIVLSNDVPSNVTGVGTMPINGLSVFIEWDDPVADRGVGSPSTGLVVEYLIFRDDVGDGDPFIFITTVAEGIGEFDDLSALGGHSYTYKILASNGIGNATGNSTTTAAVMVDNALVIQAFEADGGETLEGDARITIFNNTFSQTTQSNAQGRVFLFNATGAYNFTIVYTAQNINFLVNKTLTGVTGVVLTEDTVVIVPTNVQRISCPSNGPNRDFKILVNSTSDDHFISNFTTPVCDIDDKVSWQVQYEGLTTPGTVNATLIDTLNFTGFNDDIASGVSPIIHGQVFDSLSGDIISVTLSQIDSDDFTNVTAGSIEMIIGSNVTLGSPLADFVIEGVSISNYSAPWNDNGEGGTFITGFDHNATWFFNPPVSVSGSDIFVGVRMNNQPEDFRVGAEATDVHSGQECIRVGNVGSNFGICPSFPDMNLRIDVQTTSGGNSIFTTTMATQVLSLGDFGNNAFNFVVNGTMFNTTFASPVITSEDIVVSTNSSDVLLVFEELFLQEEETIPPGNTPGSPPPTQTAGGGGVPRLDVTTQLDILSDLFGFSLFSKIHQMQIGQIQDGTIDITWNSPSPITIEAIQVGDQFITWVGFPRQPFTIEGSDRISTGKIPYRIMPPNNLCDEVTGQTANCVDRILYEIPVKIFASVEGNPLEANTVIKVNLSLDITLALFTVFIAFVAGVGAIIYRAAIINPRANRRQRKELKTKGKERKQIENRFSANKSKLRRRP